MNDNKIFKKSKSVSKSHLKILSRLTGQPEDQLDAMIFEWGFYVVYNIMEYQSSFGPGSQMEYGRLRPDFVLPKCHTYIFFKDALIATFVADVTMIMDYIFAPHLQRLKNMIQFNNMDVTDVWRTLNPYWALWQYTDDEQEEEKYGQQMHQRMDAICDTGDEDFVIYIESGSVREDHYKLDVFSLYIDNLKELYGDSILWLNQLSMNIFITEKSSLMEELIQLRKCAYYLPEKWRLLLKDDGDLVALGRTKQESYLQMEFAGQ